MTAVDMCSCNVELSDPLYRSEGFMMFCYKILPCKKTYRHDWRVCPFAHGDETAKRRDPRIFKYTGVICPDAKKGRSCPRGDDCPCTHSLFEYWLHPTRFKTEICSRGSRCNRPFCFFAHKQSEIRKPNYRAQMQGITCEAVHHHLGPNSMTGGQLNGGFVHKAGCAAATKGGLCLETTPSPIFHSVLSSLEGSNGSLPDSGSSCCDFELSTGPWNSLIGCDSPKKETMTMTNHGQSVASYCPVFPQIPTSERNAVDWSMWHPTVVRSGGMTVQQPRIEAMRSCGLGNSFGMSPRLLDTQAVVRSLKGANSKTSGNGYDRNYLLATIKDVYQSMLTGNGDQEGRPSGRGLAGSYYGTNGTCGLEGLQQQTGCVSPHGISFCPTDLMERTLYTFLSTDSNIEAGYFK